MSKTPTKVTAEDLLTDQWIFFDWECGQWVRCLPQLPMSPLCLDHNGVSLWHQEWLPFQCNACAEPNNVDLLSLEQECISAFLRAKGGKASITTSMPMPLTTSSPIKAYASRAEQGPWNSHLGFCSIKFWLHAHLCKDVCYHFIPLWTEELDMLYTYSSIVIVSLTRSQSWMRSILLQYVKSPRNQRGCQKWVSPQYSILLLVKLWMWWCTYLIVEICTTLLAAWNIS